MELQACEVFQISVAFSYACFALQWQFRRARSSREPFSFAIQKSLNAGSWTSESKNVRAVRSREVSGVPDQTRLVEMLWQPRNIINVYLCCGQAARFIFGEEMKPRAAAALLRQGDVCAPDAFIGWCGPTASGVPSSPFYLNFKSCSR